MLCSSHIKIWNLATTWKKNHQNAIFVGEKLKTLSLMFFVSFYSCDLQDFKFYNVKHLTQVSCTELTYEWTLQITLSTWERNTNIFLLQAQNEEGKSPWSDEMSYFTLPDIPGPPLRPASKGRLHPHSFKVRYSCNNINTTLIQISLLFYFGFFSKTNHQMMLKLTPISF